MCAQSCLTLCNPMDGSPVGSSIHGILQLRILSGLPFPPPGYLPDPGTNLSLLHLLVLSGGFLITEPPAKLCAFSYCSWGS